MVYYVTNESLDVFLLRLEVRSGSTEDKETHVLTTSSSSPWPTRASRLDSALASACSWAPCGQVLPPTSLVRPLPRPSSV